MWRLVFPLVRVRRLRQDRCVHATDGVMGYGILFGIIGVALLALLVQAWRRRRRHVLESELPPLVFPLRSGSAARHDPIPAGAGPLWPAPGNGSGRAGGSAGGRVDPWPVGPSRTSDNTLQLLPGCLERIAGAGADAEIRFVRAHGDAVPEFTLGRSEGPADRHVRLEAPTVSRLHARMRFERGRWRIANLSSTNPLAVNGEALAAGGDAAELADGDEIRMGELIFRFRGGGL